MVRTIGSRNVGAFEFGLFQSPSHRGNGSNARKRHPCGKSNCFNPLHIGAMVRTRLDENCENFGKDVSIPFTSGQWFEQQHEARSEQRYVPVSIPFTSGQW